MISLAACSVFWTLLFSDGRSAPVCTDPGLTDVKPAGLHSYVSGTALDLVYVFYTGEPYQVQGYWTVEETK